MKRSIAFICLCITSTPLFAMDDDGDIFDDFDPFESTNQSSHGDESELDTKEDDLPLTTTGSAPRAIGSAQLLALSAFEPTQGSLDEEEDEQDIVGGNIEEKFQKLRHNEKQKALAVGGWSLPGPRTPPRWAEEGADPVTSKKRVPSLTNGPLVNNNNNISSEDEDPIETRKPIYPSLANDFSNEPTNNLTRTTTIPSTSSHAKKPHKSHLPDGGLFGMEDIESRDEDQPSATPSMAVGVPPQNTNQGRNETVKPNPPSNVPAWRLKAVGRVTALSSQQQPLLQSDQPRIISSSAPLLFGWGGGDPSTQ